MSSNKEAPKVTTKYVPIKVHGAKMDAKQKAVKDRDGDEFSYYHEGRNEPKPPDACLVSAVKPRAQEWEKVTLTHKTKAERDALAARTMEAMFGGGTASDSAAPGIPVSKDHEEYRQGLLKK